MNSGRAKPSIMKACRGQELIQINRLCESAYYSLRMQF